MTMLAKRHRNVDPGFSLVELLIVISIITIMTAVSMYYAFGHKKLYQTDDEALQINDILQEARQRSLTQRRTMRVEINTSTNIARLYDENLDAGTSNDDILLKTLTLFPSSNVRVDARPTEIAYNPAEPMPVPNAVFKTSVYPPSISQTVATIRFLANGSVVDAGTNATGAGAVPTGVALHIWEPNKTNPVRSDIARCITVLGATGTIRLWEYNRSSTAANKWEDSRRSGTISGSAEPGP